MDKIIFWNFDIEGLLNFIKKNKKRKIFSFLNQHDIYQVKHQQLFKKSLNNNYNINLCDGFFVSLFFSLTKLKKINRLIGPIVTRKILSDKEISTKKHFFIGLEKKEIKKLKKVIPYLNKVNCYNPPFIEEIVFDKKEIKKIAAKINNFKPNYVWLGIASPKQNILSYQLFKKTKAKYFFNIGAAMDFILEKKKEAPNWIRKIGLEWFYRLVTDFKYSKIKVWRSFIAVFYLLFGKVKIDMKD